jgi:ADP-ribosylglycohydrolase
MTRDEWFDRAYGCLIGQAVGDALGAPAEGSTPQAIRERWPGGIRGFVSDDPAGTDDTEYAMLTARIVLTYGRGLTLENMTGEWRRWLLSQDGGFNRGGFSEMDAVYNLRKGLTAPQTGSDNHEMWSDGAAMRIGPIGIYCAGDPAEAARLAGIEASVSHDRDGVSCAQAVAAAVAQAMAQDPAAPSAWEAVVEAGLRHVPADSWTARQIRVALDIGARSEGIEAAIDSLYRAIPCFYYPWADVGPEATALAFGVFAAARGAYLESVLGGANVGRDADTIAAMAGAMAGALHGAQAVPEAWRRQVNTIRGQCIRATAGMDIARLAGEFADVLAARGHS